MSTLRLDGVRHRFADAVEDVLDGVGLAVGDGELVSVVGPSGSGKTTLLRVAAGLERPTAGRVLVDGVDVTDVPTERRDLTVMFQRPHLFDHLDVLDNVAFPARVAGLGRRPARERARRYLDLVHLADLARRRTAALSGGQQQRVALARALAAERGILLLDEPFSALDRALREEMQDLLAEVRELFRPTTLLVTHDLDEAALADRTAVVLDGRLHQVAPLATLQRRPATLGTARLVGGLVEVAGTVVDGEHRSAWGQVRVDPAAGVAAGPAVLLVPRLALGLAAPGAGDEGLRVAGRVLRRRPRAGHLRVVVGLADGAAVEVEVAPDAGPAVGDEVEVGGRPPVPGWVVPAPPGR